MSASLHPNERSHPNRLSLYVGAPREWSISELWLDATACIFCFFMALYTISRRTMMSSFWVPLSSEHCTWPKNIGQRKKNSIHYIVHHTIKSTKWSKKRVNFHEMLAWYLGESNSSGRHGSLTIHQIVMCSLYAIHCSEEEWELQHYNPFTERLEDINTP